MASLLQRNRWKTSLKTCSEVTNCNSFRCRNWIFVGNLPKQPPVTPENSMFVDKTFPADRFRETLKARIWSQISFVGNLRWERTYVPQTESECSAHQVYNCEALLSRYSVTHSIISKNHAGNCKNGGKFWVPVKVDFICSATSGVLGIGSNQRIIRPIVR